MISEEVVSDPETVFSLKQLGVRQYAPTFAAWGLNLRGR